MANFSGGFIEGGWYIQELMNSVYLPLRMDLAHECFILIEVEVELTLFFAWTHDHFRPA